MKYYFFLLTLVLSPTCLGLSFSCADKSYPKEFSKSIEYEIDKSSDRTSYYVLIDMEFDGKPFDHAIAYIGDQEISVPLAVKETEVEDWAGRLVAFIHAKPGHPSVVVKAYYGFPCVAITTTKLLP